VWKCAEPPSAFTGINRPETPAFHPGGSSEEEFSTAVEEAAEYFGKPL
jgi:hypothetical protein